MGEHERGRLYPIKADGSETEPFIIKKQTLYIGSGDVCGIRLYTDCIFPEHCVLTTDKKGKVYFEPLHQTALVLVNHVKITKKYPLKHNDVITILMRSFRFAYPADSAFSEITVKTPSLPCVVETNLPKRRNSNARNSISPKNKVLPNFNNRNIPVLRVKRSATEMNNEKNIQKKQQRSSLPGKRVRFGPKLTPEEFDKRLPPSTPLRRGSLPVKICSQNKAIPEKSSSLDLIKKSRGSPLVNKSLNIANETSSTFTVNVEVHSGPKEKIGSPIKKTCRRSIMSSITKTGEFQPTSQILMPMDGILKTFELPISKVTPKFGKNVSSNLLTLQKDQKPLFSDVLKKLTAPSDTVSTINKARSPQLNTCRGKITSKSATVQQKSSERPVHQQIIAIGSTGHANSPDTIILCKKKNILEMDNTFKINVRRSPRTPRRAQYTFKRKTSKKIQQVTSNAGVFENFQDNFVKSDIKVTPSPLKKTRKSRTDSIKRLDNIQDNLYDIEISEITHNSGVLLPKQNNNSTIEQVEMGNIEKTEFMLSKEKSPNFLEKQDIRMASIQPEKCRKFKDNIKQDCLPDDLCNVEISDNYLKDVNLKHGLTQNVSAKRTAEDIAEIDVKEIAKLQPKRRRVKKDCTTEEELKTTSHELSPCRRVTRSMAKKFLSK